MLAGTTTNMRARRQRHGETSIACASVLSLEHPAASAGDAGRTKVAPKCETRRSAAVPDTRENRIPLRKPHESTPSSRSWEGGDRWFESVRGLRRSTCLGTLLLA